MSALDDLIERFGRYGEDIGFIHDRLDSYAHELAEKMRKHDENEPIDYRRPQSWRDGYSDGIQEVADLIDPQKSCGSGCVCVCHEAGTSPCDDCTGY